MKRGLLFLVLLLATDAVYSQVIPSSRVVDWSVAGIKDSITEPATLVNVKDFGALGDGTSNDYSAIVAAINSLNGKGGVIYFPPGTYLIGSTLQLKDSIVLRGAGADSSFLHFNFNGTIANCINIQGQTFNNDVKLTGGFNKDSRKLSVDTPVIFDAEDYAEIFEDNGTWDTQPIFWADNSVGQVVRIDSVSGDTIYLQQPLRFSYDSALHVRISKLKPISHVGIECLNISRSDSSGGLNNNIFFNYALNCWVHNVESSKSISSHIEIDHSSNIEISGCYIHDAYQYDGTSQHGYGILLFQHTGECLIENNIIRHLRHGVSLQCGANGNVISYNYILEPTRTEAPSNASADISLHGHFPYANLFEGNIVQNIQIDQTWGPSGPLNTFFRNRAELYGLIMSSGTVNSDQQNFVGNEIPNTGFLLGNYVLTGTNHFEFGNNVRGTITPGGTTTLPDDSYYLQSQPPFWTILPFPSIGEPNVLSSGSIPAKERFASGKYTQCTKPTSTSIWRDVKEQLTIFPVPSSGILNILVEMEGTWTINVINSLGSLVYEDVQSMNHKATIHLPLTIDNGVYYIFVSNGHTVLKQQFVLVRTCK